MARNARRLASVQRQLDLFKSDCSKLQDEVGLLRTANSNLRDTLSSIQDNAQLVVDLQEIFLLCRYFYVLFYGIIHPNFNHFN